MKHKFREEIKMTRKQLENKISELIATCYADWITENPVNQLYLDDINELYTYYKQKYCKPLSLEKFLNKRIKTSHVRYSEFVLTYGIRW